MNEVEQELTIALANLTGIVEIALDRIVELEWRIKYLEDNVVE